MQFSKSLFWGILGLLGGVFICGLCCWVWGSAGPTRWAFYGEDGTLIASGRGKPKSWCWPSERLGWQDAVAGQSGTVCVSRGENTLETIDYSNGLENGAYVLWDGRGHPQAFQWDDGETRVDVRMEDGLAVSWSAGKGKHHELRWRSDGTKHMEIMPGNVPGSCFLKRWDRHGLLVEDAEERDGMVWNGVEEVQARTEDETDEIMGVFREGKMIWRGKRQGRSAAELKLLANETEE